MTAPALDPVAEAIAAVDQPPPIVMTKVELTLFTGRPAQLVVPADMTPQEALGMIGVVLQVVERIEAQRPASRLVLPC